MCIAILNTKGTTLKKKTLRNCWENNGDGAGILYINNDNKLETFKELKDFSNFYKNYSRIKKEFGKRNMLLHFRISTHGKVNETNCHPFLVNEDVGFVHNGMIHNVPTSEEYSDTYMFNETILKRLEKDFINNSAITILLEDFIGGGNKLIILNSNDEFLIVNEKAGHWNLGCWFSNDSYRQVNSWVDFGGVKKQKGSTLSPYSYNSWNYWGSNNYNDGYDYGHYYDAKHICQGCDTKLYGEREIERKLCNWCVTEMEEELADSYGVSQCEADPHCDGDGIYREDIHAHVCSQCFDALIQEYGA